MATLFATFRLGRGRLTAMIVLCSFVAVGCASTEGPELVTVDAPSTPASGPTPVATRTPAPPATTPTPTPTPTTKPVEALSRGVKKRKVRIGLVKTGRVFGDVETGVNARLGRVNSNGGVGGRTIELVEVLDDEGDPELTLAAVTDLVENQDVFAVVLATAVPSTAVSDYLADNFVPFFGWGFSKGFCDPNAWGFGFNGCLIGRELGIDGVAADATAREVLTAFLGSSPSVVLVTAPGDATAATLAAEVWGDQLAEVVTYDAGATDPIDPVRTAIQDAAPEAVLLATGLEDSIELKRVLVGSTQAIVVDAVGYLPGLLRDVVLSGKLEGGYSLTQFPPQEEYREVTGVIATDLQNVGADLIYSQAVSLGYWSVDLMATVLGEVGPDLDTASFHRTVAAGVAYSPQFDGAPCAMNTDEVHRLPAGGAALVRVAGGIYRPAAAFSCY